MEDTQTKGSASSERAVSSERARQLITGELASLLESGGARAELVSLAQAILPSDADAAMNLSMLADAAWLAAADERAQPELDGALRIELLGRAASLATLLRIHVELQGCERVGAERALNLAEELAHNDLAGRDPDAPLPPGPRAGSSRQSSGWRTHVRSLSSWLQSG